MKIKEILICLIKYICLSISWNFETYAPMHYTIKMHTIHAYAHVP